MGQIYRKVKNQKPRPGFGRLNRVWKPWHKLVDALSNVVQLKLITDGVWGRALSRRRLCGSVFLHFLEKESYFNAIKSRFACFQSQLQEPIF